ncbi:GMC family oxidoreductase N-terminal domain-containing protein [Streptomyces sp. MST-110588]|uniref:GMC family oxidoreductase n=1 Tax=Streptomyces sp. MST-110588 TaxID=2833628 RepID=UPI001F5CE3F7|nr:GMC family oxidoreductase N-terminal domain-containing protein [Streptomyces sp. MST-110588]UNO38458.1 GMC family oxidoreductase N-terminal domain-containing protein [Streptomyces sp. MST-110588]
MNQRDGTWDVIVVGAGSAGGVLASRLSEDPSRSVLLLEAGPDYGTTVAGLPEDVATSPASTHTHDWGFTSEPGALGRPVSLPRGKLVGGSSAINSAIALRGQPGDYDNWAAGGNTGWSFADLLPAFRRVERDLDFAGPWHGAQGPVPVRRHGPGELNEPQRAFHDACVALGHPVVTDHNAPGACGVGPVPVNRVDGVRQSTALTYLARARDRANLTVRGQVLVDRVLVRGGRARGVRLADPQGTELRAGQVILAAGTYGSPPVLMRSGIGPAHHLRDLGIPVLADLPGVGGNLQDHPAVTLTFTGTVPAPADPREPVLQTFLTCRVGEERNDAGPSGTAALGASDLTAGPGTAGPSCAPDLQIFPQGPEADPDGGPRESVVTLWVALLRPYSTGRLLLRSPDPRHAPRIDVGFLRDPRDSHRLVEGMRLARRIAATPPLADLLRAERSPGPGVSTPEELTEALRRTVSGYQHAAGTCRMGPYDDPEAVVSPTGAVHGVEALYVIDASVMPGLPAANTHLTTMAIAEHCTRARWADGAVPRPPSTD